MNAEISLIIPTHNRHGYLKRILEYYSLTDISVFVVDSTAKTFNIYLENNKLDWKLIDQADHFFLLSHERETKDALRAWERP